MKVFVSSLRARPAISAVCLKTLREEIAGVARNDDNYITTKNNNNREQQQRTATTTF
ncbi:MAG: hypothetical protein LBV16_00965 [Elusimicrobiota bacterium]|nr:hypothetical protein [Elusimicrobiota bacterium]